MKNYIRPELEIQSFSAWQSVMLETFDLTASSVEGGFVEHS